jgi:SOS-response transcriptional repressor LexA
MGLKPITKVERRLYDFVVMRRKIYGVSPTLDECARLMWGNKVVSKQRVHYMMRKLVEAGWIYRDESAPRARKWTPRKEAVAMLHMTELIAIARKWQHLDLQAKMIVDLLDRREKEAGVAEGTPTTHCHRAAGAESMGPSS